jgi:hypothetical protein
MPDPSKETERTLDRTAVWGFVGFLPLGIALAIAARGLQGQQGTGAAILLMTVWIVVSPLLLHPAAVTMSMIGPLYIFLGWAPAAVLFALLGRPLYILLWGWRNEVRWRSGIEKRPQSTEVETRKVTAHIPQPVDWVPSKVEEVRCWSCKAPLAVNEQNRGQRMKCPRCGTKQALPV